MSEQAHELEELLAKRCAMQEAHMAKYHNGSASRAQTTTHNARVSQLNERIVFLRAELKRASASA